MDAIQRNTDVAGRFVGAVQDANAAARRRNEAQAETPAPQSDQTTVSLSRRAQELAARKEQESTATQSRENEQAESQRMSLLNDQLRRAYGADGSGGAR